MIFDISRYDSIGEVLEVWPEVSYPSTSTHTRLLLKKTRPPFFFECVHIATYTLNSAFTIGIQSLDASRQVDQINIACRNLEGRKSDKKHRRNGGQRKMGESLFSLHHMIDDRDVHR
jgi:hypothetical protein